MRIANLVLCASLALLGVSASDTAVAGPVGSGGLGLPTCHKGHAAGKWLLPIPGPPGPANPGHAHGVLFEKGQKAFELHAVLKPVPSPASPGTKGVLEGVLQKLVGPGAQPVPFAKLVGRWVANPQGAGHFEVLIVVPGKTPLSPPKVIGRIQGSFVDGKALDPSTGKPKPGHFGAHWKICK